MGLFITLYIYFSRMQALLKETHYDIKDSRARFDMLRNKYELELYDINKRLMMTDERWKDIYHIILSSQKDIDYQLKKTDLPKLTKFFTDMGIKKNELKINKKLVFVLTPFHENQREIFEVIQKVCLKYGFNCFRGDEKYISGDIFPHLLKNIIQARLIIANIDGRNPNVFYELGIAHAIDKPTILISKYIRDVPFDIKSRSIIIYKNKNDLVEKLKESLIKVSISEETPSDTDEFPGLYTVGLVKDLVKDRNFEVRKTIAREIPRSADKLPNDIIALINNLVEDENWEVRREIAKEIANNADKLPDEIVTLLQILSYDVDWNVRKELARRIPENADKLPKASVKLLKNLAKDEDEKVRMELAQRISENADKLPNDIVAIVRDIVKENNKSN